MDAAAEFCKEPVKYFDACGDGDQHRHDAKKGVDIGACAHGEEVVQPDDKGEKSDDDQGPDHRDISEKPFFRKGGHHFRKDAKSGQNQNIDLRMPPGPDEVDIHHGIAPAARCEKMHAEIAVQSEHDKRCSQDREGKNDEDHRAQGAPNKDRHFHQGHARAAHFQDGDQKVDACNGASHPRNLHHPYPIIDSLIRDCIRCRKGEDRQAIRLPKICRRQARQASRVAPAAKSQKPTAFKKG